MGRPPQSPEAASGFEALLEPHIDRAYGMALHLTRNRDDAADLLQEASLNAFRAFHTFKVGTNFKAWFFRILINAQCARRRMEQRQPASLDLDMDIGDVGKLYLYRKTAAAGLHDRSLDPARQFMSRMGVDQVTRAIRSLPDQYRVVALLSFVLEMNYKEIAAVLECQPGTVRSRLHRARHRLQKKLWTVAREEGIIGTERAGAVP